MRELDAESGSRHMMHTDEDDDWRLGSLLHILLVTDAGCRHELSELVRIL